MTKMTTLHFASPFAFSMPVPPGRLVATSSSGRVDDTSEKRIRSPAPPQPTLIPGADHVSEFAGDAPVAPTWTASPEMSVYDAVLQSYREQDGAGPEAATNMRAETASEDAGALPESHAQSDQG